MENKILVFGDEVVDWIDIPVKPYSSDETGANQNCFNWRLIPGTRRVAIGGGTYLIVDILKNVCTDPEIVSGPQFNSNDIPDSKKCIQSFMRIEDFWKEKCKGEEKKQEWRVKEFQGYDGPLKPQQSKIEIKADDNFKTIIIDDAANGIRNSVESNNILNSIEKLDNIVYKLARPLNAGDTSSETSSLWGTVLKKQLDKKCGLVVLLDVNDLRNEGASISHGLSWERFASDVVHFFTNPNQLSRFNEDSFKGWIIVKAGLEGAVIFPPGYKTEQRSKENSPILVYNPLKGEDDNFDEFREKGKMTGYFSVFAAAIGNCLNSSETFTVDYLIQAVKTGLLASVELLKNGFLVSDDLLEVKYPVEQIAKVINSNSVDKFQHIEIPVIPQNYSIHKRIWTIVETLKLKGIVKMAEKLVRYDDEELDKFKDKKEDPIIPCAKFGKLTTYDPSEIENYRTVKRLVREYLEAGVIDRPLSIGVFGKPGSGKSFGVKEVVSSLLPGNTPVWTFNLSEFQTVAELARTFHIIHDLTRDGSMPLIFFDEFDCSLNGEMCGWLKYFLAPMQDGKFNDGSDIHPIGRAIFVFAGGTKSSYEAFAEQEFDTDPGQKFIKAKGPDFLSRLRGYVNIMGVDPAHDKDFICIIRRATILRGNILTRAKTLGKQSHWLVNEKKEIAIEDAVLHTLLKIPSYKNGARSLSAIVESCELSLSKGLTKASLPPMHILSMHVDTKRFNELLNAKDFSDKVFIPAREKMAEMVHRYYCEDNPNEKSNVEWEKLSVQDQQQNRYQVDSIPDLLQEIGYQLELTSKEKEPYELKGCDFKNLAIAEHSRWKLDKEKQGFKKGSERSTYLMTHPDIVEWAELNEKARQKDIKAVQKLPNLLSVTGLVIVNRRI
jgi:hypothetical protein